MQWGISLPKNNITYPISCTQVLTVFAHTTSATARDTSHSMIMSYNQSSFDCRIGQYASEGNYGQNYSILYLVIGY